LADALQAAREAVRKGTPLPPPKRGDTLTDGLATPAVDPAAQPSPEPAPNPR
jgi:hypothetical protein